MLFDKLAEVVPRMRLVQQEPTVQVLADTLILIDASILIPDGERLVLARVLDRAYRLGLHFNPLHSSIEPLKRS